MNPPSLLLRPLTLGALGLLVLNDHVLKPTFHNALTGKLSDVAILILLPMLVAGGAELAGTSANFVRRVGIGGAAICALVMILINVHEPSGEVYRVGMGVFRMPLDFALATIRSEGTSHLPNRVDLVMDSNDAFTVPAALISLRAIWRATAARKRPAAQDAVRSPKPLVSY